MACIDATFASSATLASSRPLAGRLLHWMNPQRDTPNSLHILATGYKSLCRSIQVYFTATPSRKTPPLFLGFHCPASAMHSRAAALSLPLPVHWPVASWRRYPCLLQEISHYGPAESSLPGSIPKCQAVLPLPQAPPTLPGAMPQPLTRS